MNERTRAWADTTRGKEIQCQVFGALVEEVKKLMEDGDSKYERVGVRWLESKTVSNIDPTGCAFQGLDGTPRPMTAKDCFTFALQRLEEHKLVFINQYSKGEGVKISKLGWQRWESHH